jgi:hypothetical protein
LPRLVVALVPGRFRGRAATRPILYALRHGFVGTEDPYENIPETDCAVDDVPLPRISLRDFVPSTRQAKDFPCVGLKSSCQALILRDLAP